LLHFLACCFKLSPSTAQPVFEFWSQLKEMRRENILSDAHVKALLLPLTEPCTISLLRYVRRDSAFSLGAPEDLSLLRDMSKDVASDVYCLWQRCDDAASAQFVTFLSERLVAAIDQKDAVSAESALVLLEGITDVLEGPFPSALKRVLQGLPGLPNDGDAMAAAAVFLQRCAPHVNEHASVMPDLVAFLLRALPAAPFTVAESLLDLTGYAGHHLCASWSPFLAEVERVAPGCPVKVDVTLYSSVVCTVRRLPLEQRSVAFRGILQSTLDQVSRFEAQTSCDADVGLLVSAASRESLFRLLSRTQRCIWTLEQTPAEPDGPPPTDASGRDGDATCILAVLAPAWHSLSRVTKAVLEFPTAHAASPVPGTDSANGSEPSCSVADIATVVVKIVRSCIAALQAHEVTGPDADAFSGSLLVLLVEIVRCGPLQNGAFLLLVDFASLALHRGLHADFASALWVVCESVVSKAWLPSSTVNELSGFFALLLASAVDFEEALYTCPSFGKIQELAVMALSSGDRELNKALLQFVVRFATSSCPAAQSQFRSFAPPMVTSLLQHFHLWPQATRKHSSQLFVVMLERHAALFRETLVCVWQQPGTVGIHTALNSQQREVCAKLFEQLRGPRFKAFLGDLVAVANGAQTVDVLVAYEMCRPSELSSPVLVN